MSEEDLKRLEIEIRNKLAQEHNWEAQEKHWEAQQRNWEMQKWYWFGIVTFGGIGLVLNILKDKLL